MKQPTLVLCKNICVSLILLFCLPLPAASASDAREIYRISLGPNEVQGDKDSTIARISANGMYIAFASRATNLGGGTSQTMKVYLYNRTTGAVHPYFPSGSSGDVYPTALSADGRYVVLSALSMYRPLQQDVAIYDQQDKTTVCASVGTDSACTHGGHEGSISGDGRYVVQEIPTPVGILILLPVTARISSFTTAMCLAQAILTRPAIFALPAFQPPMTAPRRSMNQGIRSSPPTGGMWCSGLLLPTWFQEIPTTAQMFSSIIAMCLAQACSTSPAIPTSRASRSALTG